MLMHSISNGQAGQILAVASRGLVGPSLAPLSLSWQDSDWQPGDGLADRVPRQHAHPRRHRHRGVPARPWEVRVAAQRAEFLLGGDPGPSMLVDAERVVQVIVQLHRVLGIEYSTLNTVHCLLYTPNCENGQCESPH